MARIYIQNECCVPTTCECREDREIAHRFRTFCEEPCDEDSPDDYGGGEKGDGGGEKGHGGGTHLDIPITPATTEEPVVGEQEKEAKRYRFDCVCIMIIIAYLLALIILGLGVWAYVQDSHWNGVVMQENPFPNIEGETYISGSYLFMYEDRHERLKSAKAHMLRQDRWLDIAHLLFICSFIIFTVVQFSSYVTKSNQDHSRLVIFYYSIFGGVGLLVALFPTISWNYQESSNKMAADDLRDFAAKFDDDSMFGQNIGLNNATRKDATSLAQILEFCSHSSSTGLSSDPAYPYIDLFRRRYVLEELQTFGFCTHHRTKIVTSWMSFLFALICLCTPCIFCFGSKEPSLLSTSKVSPSPAENLQPMTQESGNEQTRRHSESETIEELKKFRMFVEGDSDEQGPQNLDPT